MPVSRRFVCAFVFLSVVPTTALLAQDHSASLAGTVSDSSGKAIANVKIRLKNLSTGETVEAQPDASGNYSVANLNPGKYEVSASADASGVAAQKVTLTSGASQTVNLTLSQSGAAGQSLPNALAPNTTEPTLSDLGFSAAETQADAGVRRYSTSAHTCSRFTSAWD